MSEENKFAILTDMHFQNLILKIQTILSIFIIPIY